MQSRLKLFFILFASIFLVAACQYPSSKTVSVVQFATSQHETINDSDFVQSDLIQPARSIGAEAETDHLEEIGQVLRMIETGRTTLQLIERYEIGINFELGNGSRFRPSRNEIVIDSKLGRFSAALILVHEVTHARFFHEGVVADVTMHSRQTYVQQKTEEEMNAMAASIEATMELWEAGVDVVNVRPAFYYPYRQAYGSAVRAAKHDYPGLDEVTLRSIGRAAGQSTLLEALLSGEVVTSVSQETYAEYWGSVWDGKHNS